MVNQATRALVGVVEDDPYARRAMARLLQVSGFDTAVFESAEACIEALPGKALHCLIVDVQLGGMSGIDLQCLLRRIGCTVPVIVMTAHREETIRDRAERNGCAAFLWKPIGPDVLLQSIRSINPDPYPLAS